MEGTNWHWYTTRYPPPPQRISKASPTSSLMVRTVLVLTPTDDTGVMTHIIRVSPRLNEPPSRDHVSHHEAFHDTNVDLNLLA